MSKSLVLVFHKEENAMMFERVILALKSRYKLVSVEELEELVIHKKMVKNICHISFDDGDRSFYKVVYPLLLKHQVPVSLFVSPEIISAESNFWFQDLNLYDSDKMKELVSRSLGIPFEKIRKFLIFSIFKCLTSTGITKLLNEYKHEMNFEYSAPQNMNAKELLEVEKSGMVTIGAHTMHHPVLKNEDDIQCFYEIGQSIKELETLLGHSIKYFAYPNGRPGIDFDYREMNCLRENNITMAFSTELDHLSSSTDPLSIPRMSFARMGLLPSNAFVSLRMEMGKNWINIKSIGKPSEKKVREKIFTILNP